MSKRIIFWGAGGHARVLRELVERIGYELVAVFDNERSAASPFGDVPLHYGVAGLEAWLRQHAAEETYGLVAIGSIPHDRLEIEELLRSKGIRAVVAVHPTAFAAGTAVLSEGCQILGQASVCADARLGRACIVNTGAIVDHDCALGDAVHVGPGAVLAGYVSAGDFSFVGMGALVLDRRSIGRDVIVGAGSVVTRDVPDGKVVYGNPAKIVRDNVMVP